MTKKNSDRAPHLGIFWLVNGKLIIDSSLLSKAEPYGDHLTHPRSHIRVWATFERSGRVLRGSEYDEYPRGRVMHHPASGEFTILADRCILKRKDMIAQIKKALHLRNKVKTGTDLHYRCPLCLREKQINEDEDRGGLSWAWKQQSQNGFDTDAPHKIQIRRRSPMFEATVPARP